MPVVFLVLLVLGILAIQFHKMAMHAQATASRFEQNGIMRRVAEIALREALAGFSQANSASSKQYLEFLSAQNSALITWQVPIISQKAQSWVRGNFTVDVKVEISRVDFRNYFFNSKTKEQVKYSGKEVVGTLGFKAIVTLNKSGKKVSGCTFVRHHDFKLVAVRTKQPSVRKYSSCFPLNYVLLVRKGLKEFRDTQAKSLNPDPKKVSLEIHQGESDDLPPEQRGKIFFGGTSNPSLESANKNFVFINIGENEKNFIPTSPSSSRVNISWNDLKLLFPHVFSYLDTFDPDNIKSQLQGFFTANNVPVSLNSPYSGSDPVLAVDEFNRMALSEPPLILEKNNYPGIKLLSGANCYNPQFADSILEGDIRQRFLHSVYFDLDGKALAKAKCNYDAILYPALAKFPSSFLNNLQTFAQHLVRDFGLNVEALSKTRPNDKILANFDSDYPLKGQQAWGSPSLHYFVQPGFFDYRNQPKDFTNDDPSIFPFAFKSLVSAKTESRNFLEKVGVLKNDGFLNLTGIIYANFPLEIGGSTPLKARGSGVIIADSITLNVGITKDSPDVSCILYSKGDIKINTDQPIWASLIALNDRGTGKISPTKPMNLKGSLAVDILDTPNWQSAGPHKIIYDGSLKGSEDSYQLNILPWITFERVTE